MSPLARQTAQGNLRVCIVTQALQGALLLSFKYSSVCSTYFEVTLPFCNCQSLLLHKKASMPKVMTEKKQPLVDSLRFLFYELKSNVKKCKFPTEGNYYFEATLMFIYCIHFLRT